MSILNCFDRLFLSHLFLNLITFPLFFMSSAVVTTETIMRTDWSNRICEKKFTIRKKYSLLNDDLLSSGLQRLITKIGKIFTLYHRELMKIPSLFMFCMRSLVRGLTRLFFWATQLFSNQKTNTYYLCSTALCVCVCLCVCSSQGTKSDFCSISINILCVNLCGLPHCRSYGKTRVHAPTVV